MVAKVGRHIADPQPAARLAIVVVRRRLRRQRLGKETSPLEVLFQQHGRIVVGQKIQRVQQIAAFVGIVRQQLHRFAVIRDRLFAATQQEQRVGHDGRQLVAFRAARNCAVARFQRLVGATRIVQKDGQVGVSLGKVGPQPESLSKTGNRLVKHSLEDQYVGPIVVGRGQIGPGPQGPLVELQGFVDSPSNLQEIAVLVQRLDVIGLEPQHLKVGRRGALEISLDRQDVPQSVASLDEIGAKAQRFSIAANRLVPILKATIRVAQIGVHVGRVGDQAQGLLQLRERFRKTLQGHQRDAQVVERVGVVRLALQGGSIGLDRLGRSGLCAENVAQLRVGRGKIGLQAQSIVRGDAAPRPDG